jgi:hypothetical protein
MGRIGTAAAAIILAGLAVSSASAAQVEQPRPAIRLAQAASPDAPPRRVYRPQARLRVTPNYDPDTIYPHYNPGPNAVRVCTAHYVQEYRPSGTVIVPRMSCYWQR